MAKSSLGKAAAQDQKSVVVEKVGLSGAGTLRSGAPVPAEAGKDPRRWKEECTEERPLRVKCAEFPQALRAVEYSPAPSVETPQAQSESGEGRGPNELGWVAVKVGWPSWRLPRPGLSAASLSKAAREAHHRLPR